MCALIKGGITLAKSMFSLTQLCHKFLSEIYAIGQKCPQNKQLHMYGIHFVSLVELIARQHRAVVTELHLLFTILFKKKPKMLLNSLLYL